MSQARTKPKLGVFKFASCDGCQLSLLDAEDQLLAVAGALDIAYFLEASSRIDAGPYDVALVEGSITTPDDAERVQEVRRKSKFLITIGACATAGGIQALPEADEGDYVIVHAGIAISRIDAQEAQRVFKALAELNDDDGWLPLPLADAEKQATRAQALNTARNDDTYR